MKKSRLDGLPRLHVETRQQVREWLLQNRGSSSGVWLVTWRRVTGRPRPEYSDIVEELLCFGWIDGKLVQLDEERTMLLCTPRNPRSEWSRSNRERVERLSKLGLMQPRGLELVAIAKATGTWDSMDEVDNLVEPPELAAALDAAPGARMNWEAFLDSYKRQCLFQLHTAKRTATRQACIERIVDAAVNGRGPVSMRRTQPARRQKAT